ncbi:uncharacterized protein [Medicago truncatula]|uniref:uncharacterized protein n=1 Tax=Medicago truncatula TaxID=3880 RepID=UPI000D2F1AC6|nr:uncharacterized protein LOC112420844 [Medicago truncatula]
MDVIITLKAGFVRLCKTQPHPTQNPAPHYIHLCYHRLSPLHYTCLSPLSYVSLPPEKSVVGFRWLYLVKVVPGGFTHLIVYIDVIGITGSDQQGRLQLKQHPSNEFQTKDLGKLSYFLGIEIAQSKDGVVISQGKYAMNILEETCLLNAKPIDTPMVWTNHGEQMPPINTGFDVNTHASCSGTHTENVEQFDMMDDMISDALGVNMSYDEPVEEELPPNKKAQDFYNLLEKINEPLFEGSNDSKLPMCARLLAAKSNWNVPDKCLEHFVKMLLDATPIKDNLPKSYHEAKRLVSKLGLESKRIDCCSNGCMLFYNNEFGTNDGALEECKFCNEPRYVVRNDDVRRNHKRIPVKSMFYLPILPRLQRLYASMQTASQMTWHYSNKSNPPVMRHPCDGEAWKHFDRVHHDFASDPRNVRLGLCSDGFTPYIQASATPYSCWPIIFTPYNLPPEMCMSKPYMFLTCLIPGPSSPLDGIDVYLQPLIDDLKRLWIGQLTYDIAKRENFNMRAALMWTINDFPAYGMLSGWGTHGRLACLSG